MAENQMQRMTLWVTKPEKHIIFIPLQGDVYMILGSGSEGVKLQLLER